MVNGCLNGFGCLGLIPGCRFQGDEAVGDQHSQGGVALGNQSDSFCGCDRIVGAHSDVHQRRRVHDVPHLGELAVQQPSSGLALPRRTVTLESDDPVAGSAVGQT